MLVPKTKGPFCATPWMGAIKPSRKTVSAPWMILIVDDDSGTALLVACRNPSLHEMLKSVVSAALRHSPFTQKRAKFSFCTKNARPSRLVSHVGKLAVVGTINVSKIEIGASRAPFPVPFPFAGLSSELQPAVNNDANKAAKTIAVKPNFSIYFFNLSISLLAGKPTSWKLFSQIKSLMRSALVSLHFGSQFLSKSASSPALSIRDS